MGFISEKSLSPDDDEKVKEKEGKGKKEKHGKDVGRRSKATEEGELAFISVKYSCTVKSRVGMTL